MNSTVSLIKCQQYQPDLVEQKVREALALLGGMENFIRPQSRVLVKPNLLMAKEPEFGITTHPEVVRAAVRLLKEMHCEILLGDGPSVWGGYIENVDDVYARTGMQEVCREEGITLVKFEQRRMRQGFPLTTWLDSCDYVLNMPKFKTHDFTLLTGAIKNLFGCVSGTFKTELHKNHFDPQDFARVLVDIYAEVKPALTLVDGIVAMEGDGPGSSGKLRNTGLLLAGADGVAIDTLLALVMGVRPLDVGTTKVAAERGSGLADINLISLLGEKLEDAIGEPFLLPTTSFKKNIPRPVINLAKKLIRYYPCVEQDNCIKCAACIQACPNKIISLKNNRIVFDYSRCIACFCCQEACPAAAIKVKKSIVAKLIGL